LEREGEAGCALGARKAKAALGETRLLGMAVETAPCGCEIDLHRLVQTLRVSQNQDTTQESSGNMRLAGGNEGLIENPWGLGQQ
jgi:hypothetical protein